MTGALDESIVTIQTIAPSLRSHTTTMGYPSPIPRHGTYVIHHLMVYTYVCSSQSKDTAINLNVHLNFALTAL